MEQYTRVAAECEGRANIRSQCVSTGMCTYVRTYVCARACVCTCVYVECVLLCLHVSVIDSGIISQSL